MDICIVGAGAIGGWVAGRLAAAGSTVMGLTSRGPLAEIEISQAGRTERIPLEIFAGPADILIVAVKAPALETIARGLRQFVGPDTIIVPMLNGVPSWFLDGEPLKSVDPSGSIAAALPLDQVVGSVVYASCYRDAPNRVVVKDVNRLILGEPRGGSSERVNDLQALFERAGIPCEATGNIRRAIWYKLWGNATINPLSALTRATTDRLLADPGCRAWILECMGELSALGGAIGCPIDESAEDRIEVTAAVGSFKTSMLQDVEAGRPIEVEALLGAPREIATRVGMATPALDRLYALARLLAQSIALAQD